MCGVEANWPEVVADGVRIMALVTVKNPDLYRGWINYLMAAYGIDHSTPEIRTKAFFESQSGKAVPVFY